MVLPHYQRTMAEEDGRRVVKVEELPVCDLCQVASIQWIDTMFISAGLLDQMC